MRLFENKSAQTVLGLLLTLLAIVLVRHTISQGQDFDVFWRTARYVLDGQTTYSVQRDWANVYKYPPWSVPAFFPFAMAPLWFAKWVWALLQVASLFYVGRFLANRVRRRRSVFIPLLLFWGIWVVHALDGQVNLMMLAGALWASERFARVSVIQAPSIVWFLSLKIFTGLGVVGYLGVFRNWKAWASTVLVLGGLSLPSLWVAPRHSPAELLASWSLAASSAGALFHNEKVRGRDNQGLPALVLRVAKVPAIEHRTDVYIAAGLALLLGLAWFFYSQGARPLVRQAGWLALIPVVHPLAWFHLFVFAFPIVVLAWDGAIAMRRQGWLALVLLATLLIAAFTQKTLGAFGLALEMASVKSWGVLLAMFLAPHLFKAGRVTSAGLAPYRV
ncbi:MAG: glycosyltransferase family 87 protein [Bacteriovoracia bacterium]